MLGTWKELSCLGDSAGQGLGSVLGGSGLGSRALGFSRVLGFRGSGVRV